MPKKKYPDIDIYCEPRKGFLVGMSKTRQNYGHDDSLPYQADIMILDSESGDKEFRKIGTVSNSGWGGPSEIHCWQNPEDEKKADGLCREHTMIVGGSPICQISLGDTLDVMAEIFLEIAEVYPTRIKKQNVLWRFDDDPFLALKKRKTQTYWVRAEE